MTHFCFSPLFPQKYKRLCSWLDHMVSFELLGSPEVIINNFKTKNSLQQIGRNGPNVTRNHCGGVWHLEAEEVLHAVGVVQGEGDRPTVRPDSGLQVLFNTEIWVLYAKCLLFIYRPVSF